MKKGNLIDKLITLGIVAAGVGGALYLLKDKLEEDPKYKESMDKAKDTIKKYTATVKKAVDKENFDDFMDDFDDFDDFDELLHPAEKSDRGYVTIKLHEEDYDSADGE